MIRDPVVGNGVVVDTAMRLSVARIENGLARNAIGARNASSHRVERLATARAAKHFDPSALGRVSTLAT
jgi:hypothetical protein